MANQTLYNLQRNNVSKFLHVFSLYLIVVGLVCSKAMISIGMIIGGASVLMDPLLKEHMNKWKSNQFLVLIFVFLLLHLISFTWSSNLDYALNDLKTKVSILVIPLIIISKPLDKEKVKESVIILFLVSLFVTSLINVMCYYQLFGPRTYDDIRGLSLFGSHIRYSILIAFACVICVDRLVRKKTNVSISIILFLWFCFYVFFSQVLSAYIALFFGFATFFSYLLMVNKKYRYLFLFVSFVLLFFLSLVAFIVYPENNADLEINEIELSESWCIKSDIPIHQKDNKNQEIKYTIIRYLHSKSLPANAEGVSALTSNDVKNIENGVADYRELNNGFLSRLYSIRFEYHHAADPNGHSLLQRLEYWETGISIIKQNWFFGVGSGDVQDAFDQQYAQSHSKLKLENRKRAHNTFLTIWISFGLLGMLFFYYILFYFMTKQWQNKQVLGLVFIVIMFSTFLFEDTLETQTGITFFSFFYAWFAVGDLAFSRR